MLKKFLNTFIISISLIEAVLGTENIINKDLNDKPELHPGHLKPLGAFMPQTEIEAFNEYPSPQGILQIFQVIFMQKCIEDPVKQLKLEFFAKIADGF